jgi:hypothetical protein
MVTPAELAALTEPELLQHVIEGGGRLLEKAKQRLAAVGDLEDDPRWSAPLPLRFEPHLAVMFLGCIDAFAVGAQILGDRATQQAFGSLRFQMESFALINWLTEPSDPQARQDRSYMLTCDQIRRWQRLLIEDARRDRNRDAIDAAKHAREWGRRLREITAEDGVGELERPPRRMELFRDFGPKSGYPMFSLLSELGSHPGAAGNTLFSVRPDTRKISYDMSGSWVARAFFVSVGVVYLCHTCEVVGKVLGWDDWVDETARPTYNAAAPFVYEAMRRRQAERSPSILPRIETAEAAERHEGG